MIIPNNEQVNVTMLGVSTTGKTCYMLAMYGMMSLGIGLDGFTMVVPDEADLKSIAEDWTALIDPVKAQERWPLPTPGEPRTYNFSLCFALNKSDPIVDFDWFEYRGGALLDFSSNSADVKALQERLQITSCIIICVSGEHLVSSPGLIEYNRIGVNRINQIIGDSIGAGNNIPPAIAIVITKYDLCSNRDWNEIVKDIKKMFSPFFSEETKWLVLICPVTLGYGLKKSSTSAEMEGVIDPVNIHHPIIFSLYAELLRKNWKLDSSLENNLQILDEFDDNPFRQIFERRKLARNEDNLDQILRKINKVREGLELILRKIDHDDLQKNSRLFFDGKEVEFKDIAG